VDNVVTTAVESVPVSLADFVTDHPHIAATPIGRLVTMEEVADATDFLLRNTGMNVHDLRVDGGFLAR
jgi:NAD(P)-dependent dehydrogenase (short-subunit alcohol dehydrogenase family)